MIATNRSRRQFLVGTGGFTLALPFLPSLFTSTAQAQAAATVRPRFVAFATHHGGAWNSNVFPKDSLLTETASLYSDHQIKRGQLRAESNGGNNVLSNVLSASSSKLTERMVGKMNVLRGVDVPFYLGHHTGGHLGNYARADRQYSEGDFVGKLGGPRPTIDQVMAYSDKFYPDLGGIRERSLHVGTDGGHSISWGYSNPTKRTGDVQNVPSAKSSLQLFNSIFVPMQTQTSTPAPTRTPVVDRVLESYRRLNDGAFGDARRLSAADKRRLEEHMDRLAELERRVNVSSSSAMCGSLSKPTQDASLDKVYENNNDVEATKRHYALFNDVIVAGFLCGTSRIATVYSAELWSPYSGDWHQEVAHQSNQPDGEKQRTLYQAYQRFFEFAFLDLAKKLDDVDEGNDKSFLDNTLVQWTMESGSSTHNPLSIPVITAGSAAGYLKTGNYVDYRNKNAPSLGHGDEKDFEGLQTGILYNQWLGTALQAMNIPPSEFERSGEKGYGSPFSDAYYGENKVFWPQRLFQDASKPMPLITTKG